MTNKKYVVREAKKCETEEIVALLEEHYIPEELLLQTFILNSTEEVSEEESKYMTESLRAVVTNFTTLVAVHEVTGEIAGAIIVVPSQNPHLSSEKELMRFAGKEKELQKSKILADFVHSLSIVYEKAEMFERFPTVRSALKLRFLAVDKNHRGRSLSIVLMKESIEYARRNDFDLVYSLFVSPFAKSSARKVGLKSIMDYDIQTFRDSKGLALFDGFPNIASIMILEVGKWI